MIMTEMGGLNWLGKSLILIGAFIVGIGLLLTLAPKILQIPWLGRLPGDIVIERKNFMFYFPLTTSILLSILLTFIFILFRR